MSNAGRSLTIKEARCPSEFLAFDRSGHWPCTDVEMAGLGATELALELARGEVATLIGPMDETDEEGR